LDRWNFTIKFEFDFEFDDLFILHPILNTEEQKYYKNYTIKTEKRTVKGAKKVR
jgi:hypothetical protein